MYFYFATDMKPLFLVTYPMFNGTTNQVFTTAF
jgi:hypothetical protein